MKMNRNFLLLITGFLLGALPATVAFSQDVEFTVSANPDVLTAGEQFSLIFSSNERIDDVNLPELPDFQFLGGPMTSESRSVQMAGGKVTSVANYQYIFYYMALKEGKFTIPPATATISNRQYTSAPIVIQVAAGANLQTDPGGDEEAMRQTAEPDQNSLFIRLITDKSDLFIGEPVEITVKLYTRVDISGFNPGFKGPDLQGFFTEMENGPGTVDSEVYNGVVYNTAVLRKYFAIPQKTGEIILEPFTVDVAVRQEVSRRMASPFFDDFFFPEIEEVPVTLSSKPLTIKVKPLPPHAPESFTGAVGNFSITSSINSLEADVNEPLTLRYLVNGIGNIKLVNELRTTIPADIEIYEPVVGTAMEGPVTGTRSFEYMLIPHAPGIYVIPEVAFTYFDPSMEEYLTVNTESYTINVTGVPGNNPLNTGILRDEVELLSNDIRFIKTGSIRLNTKDRYFAGSLLYYFIIALIIAGFIAGMLINRRINSKVSDVAGLRKRKADKYAAKRLKNCRLLLEQGRSKEFYDELLSALWKYLADKFNIPMARLSRETAGEALSSQIDDNELAERFFRITAECEMARYSRNTGATEPKELYSDAVEIVSLLQQKLK